MTAWEALLAELSDSKLVIFVFVCLFVICFRENLIFWFNKMAPLSWAGSLQVPIRRCLPGLFAAGEVPVAKGQVMLVAGDQRNC